MSVLYYDWKELNRADKTSVITSAVMRDIYIRGKFKDVAIQEIGEERLKKYLRGE